MPELHVRASESAEKRRKPVPTLTKASPQWKWKYAPSADGSDSNLLVLLHGLGDTMKPFFDCKVLSLCQCSYQHALYSGAIPEFAWNCSISPASPLESAFTARRGISMVELV